MLEHEIEFGGDPQDVTIVATGPASAAGFTAVFDELASDPRFRPEIAILLDLSELDVSAIATADVRDLATTTAADERLVSCTFAIVAPEPAVFGLVRLGEAVAQPAIKTRICRSREEALDWLRARRLQER